MSGRLRLPDARKGWAGRRPPGILEPNFSGVGLVVGAFFVAVSLGPSLLPRVAWVQGIASGVSFMVGYALGASGHSVWNYLQIPNIRGRARFIVGGSLLAIIGVTLGLAIWRWVGWQNEIRHTFDMPDVSPTAWPIVIVVGVMIAAIVLIVSRFMRKLFRIANHLLDRWLPRRLSIALGVTLASVTLWLVLSGLLVQGFFAASNALFSVRDRADKPGVEQPTSALRSGGEGSLVAWEDLGRQGRSFVSSGPTVEDLDDYWGSGSMEPIRVYVGLRSADTLEERADLLLDELIRTGAFEREALVLGTVTGTGYLDPAGVDPLEYLLRGDVAIAGVQYSYLPSWISLLADQQVTRDTSLRTFRTVYDYWATLPEDERPELYLYGLSLGSFGVEAVLGSIDILNEQIDGALMAGPPFVNPLHTELTDARAAGSSAWLPVVGEGRTVRFTGEEDSLDLPAGVWGDTRVVYLQHGSDPVVFFSPELAFREPDWLKGSERAPDVSNQMSWFPVVTMWQVLLDMPAAGSIPDGYGHLYSYTANLQAWVGVTDPGGWTFVDTRNLAAHLEDYAAAREDYLDNLND